MRILYSDVLDIVPGVTNDFYRAMLCMRGTIAMGLCSSVSLSVCPSVRHKSVFY